MAAAAWRASTRATATVAAAAVRVQAPRRWATADTGKAATTFIGDIGLTSLPFADLLAAKAPFVDKTSAIADLLAGDDPETGRAFFARPRKFGKSLTLDIAGAILAAGELPPGVKAWKGYKMMAAPAALAGTAVYERFTRGDLALGDLLRRAHFVVSLDLGDAATGAKLEARIMASIAATAGSAFGPALKAEVLARSTVDAALEALVDAVPEPVPVAVLVDEYDSAIIQDVTHKQWGAARAGIAALRSLMMASKSKVAGARIQHFIVTGVARFAKTALFSGANNFTDLTDSVRLSAAIGFTDAEIRATFPAHLARLASNMGCSVDDAMRELADWYNGYCFDGETTCFNPFGVLSSLHDGAVCKTVLEGATSTAWLGVQTRTILEELAAAKDGVRVSRSHRVDIADLEAECVDTTALLLQTGVLTLAKPGLPPPAPSGSAGAAKPAAGGTVLAVVPNLYARQAMRAMLASALGLKFDSVEAEAQKAKVALMTHNPWGFSDAVQTLLQSVPHQYNKAAVVAATEEGVATVAGGATTQAPGATLREAAFQATLHGFLTGIASPRHFTFEAEWPVQAGRADFRIQFQAAGALPAATWVIELGVNTTVDEKLTQAMQYAAALSGEVLVCAVVVEKRGSASTKRNAVIVHVSWQRREGGTWVAVPQPPTDNKGGNA